MAGGDLWNKKETDVLIENYPYYDNKTLKEKFLKKRSEVSIQKKAYKLGIKKEPETLKQIIRDNAKKAKEVNYKGWYQKKKGGHIFLTFKDGTSIQEHRYIMEQQLGRKLRENEVVHHKNGIPFDNRLENLEVLTNTEHTRLHHVGSKRNEKTRKKISEKTRERFKNKKNHPSYRNINKEKMMNLIEKHKSPIKVSNLLGVSRKTVYNKIKEFNLEGWYKCLTESQ